MRRAVAAAGLLVALLAGCGGSSRTSAATTVSAGGPLDRWGITWLCRPGELQNPCVTDLTTTAIGPRGARRVERIRPAESPPVDCFYVYPTVSGELSVNANLAIDSRLQLVVGAQAARFAQVCRIYAPVYRQITLTALEHPGRITRADAQVAYDSVLRAFRVYLAHYNDGRGIVFIGHSQGAIILERLLATEVDPTALRRRVVSALLLGGNLTNRDFAHIPACRSSAQTGCVVAYSSFATKPSVRSEFGRTTSDAGVGLLAGKRPPGARILCVDPAAPAGGTGSLHPALPSLVLAFTAGKGGPSVSTPWVSFPGRYTARCESSGDATWLQVTATTPGASPRLTQLADPALGLHLLDVNIALDDLVRLVRAESSAYVRHGHAG